MDMATEELRLHGYTAVDWVADYLDRVSERPVLARIRPGEVRSRIPAEPPATGEPMEEILADLDSVVLPGITHWQHPRFLAYFAITGSGPGILGELVAAGLNANGMLWRTSPAVTEVEQAALDWLRSMLGLPPAFHGIIMDTASMSTLVALAAARHRRWPDVREAGPQAFAGARPRLYASEEAHSSVDKAAIALGLGHEAVRKIPTDDAWRMDAAALRRAIEEDVAGEWAPFAVVATVGTTVATAIDPVPAIAEICAAHDLWLHVDGAYGGVAAIVPDKRDVLAGADRADSIVVNPHKWLATPIDCSAFYVRDPSMLKAAFSLVPDYLATDEEGIENYMDWGVQLGRRFRGLKLWFVLRWFGTEGLAAMIREHVRLAGIVRDWAEGHPGFEVAAPVELSAVCLRARFDATPVEEDARNVAIVETVNAGGRAYLSTATLGGRTILRVAIGNARTTEDDVREVLDLLEEAHAAV